MCHVCAQTRTSSSDAWNAIEEERATFLSWAAGQAKRTLNSISDAAAEAYEQGGTVDEARALAEQVVREAKDPIRDLLRTIYLRVMPHFGNQVHSQFAEASRALHLHTRRGELGDDFWAEVVDKFVREKAGDLVTGILRGHVKDLRAIIAAGVEEGLGIDKIAKRLREELPGVDRKRARRIARTEVIRASNFGSVEGARATGLAMKKEWIATPDTRTRPSHSAAGGQLVGLDEPFSVGGYSADYPGDSALPAEESVNCRCTVAFIVEDEERAAVILPFYATRLAA